MRSLQSSHSPEIPRTAPNSLALAAPPARSASQATLLQALIALTVVLEGHVELPHVETPSAIQERPAPLTTAAMARFTAPEPRNAVQILYTQATAAQIRIASPRRFAQTMCALNLYPSAQALSYSTTMITILLTENLQQRHTISPEMATTGQHNIMHSSTPQQASFPEPASLTVTATTSWCLITQPLISEAI